MYMIKPGQKQFKANLHCHSTLSDGKLTPQQLKAAYKEKGYSILAITDHEAPFDHTAMSEPDFMMLTGYEAYIRPIPFKPPYDAQVHLNLLAKDPHNVTLIGYEPASCKYITQERIAELPKASPEGHRDYTVPYVNDFIRVAKENGYLVTYNHPVWSLETDEYIMGYEGCFSMEMCNYGCYTLNHMEYNGALYDRMLRNGKWLYVHSADDNHNGYPFGHPKCDSFGGAAMILADALCYDKVVEAMEQGDMYSTMGPVFEEVSFDGENVHVKCSDVAAIVCHCGSCNPTSAWAEEGKTINEATLYVGKKAMYVRISICDSQGRYADTRAYSREELGMPPRDTVD